jgi:hypothetical protein
MDLKLLISLDGVHPNKLDIMAPIAEKAITEVFIKEIIY